METKKDRFGEYCGQYISDILIIMVAYVKKFFSTMYKDQIIATNLLSGGDKGCKVQGGQCQ